MRSTAILDDLDDRRPAQHRGDADRRLAHLGTLESAGYVPITQTFAAAIGDTIRVWAILGIVAWTVVLAPVAVGLSHRDKARRCR